MTRKFLLVCGILAALLYAELNVFVAGGDGGWSVAIARPGGVAGAPDALGVRANGRGPVYVRVALH
jgi:hypothetical protein